MDPNEWQMIVFDANNHPIAGAWVEAVFGRPSDADHRYDDRRSVETDVNGEFELRGLLPAPVILQVQKLNDDSQLICRQARLDLGSNEPMKQPVMVTARPFKVPANAKIYSLLGIQLIEINDGLRDQLSPYSFETLLLVDPGKNQASNGFRPGDAFWDTDARQRIKDFHDLVKQLLAACETQKKSGRLTYSVGIYYDYIRPHEARSSTLFLNLKQEDVAELQNLLKPQSDLQSR